jgi:hypothetical protein
LSRFFDRHFQESIHENSRSEDLEKAAFAATKNSYLLMPEPKPVAISGGSNYPSGIAQLRRASQP